MNQTEEKSKRKPRTKPAELPTHYDSENHQYEIGIDEAGRGPLFGRLYVAGVVLPKDGSVNMEHIRDSKKLTKKRLDEMYDYVREKAIVYHIEYVESEEIDEINIREAVLKAMNICATQCAQQLQAKLQLASSSTEHNTDSTIIPYFLCVDGNDCPACHINGNLIPGKAFKGGDNLYGSMAAASILAKVARDRYIVELCEKIPKLSEYYKMDKHKGYGTKDHLDAIRTHGVTKYHRKTFGICKTAKENTIII